MNFSVFVMGVALIGICSHSATAQTAAERPADQMDTVPDEYIEEASTYYDECRADHTMSQYYNCECQSVAYLDERIKQGPVMPSDVIRQNIQNLCRDAVGAAGPVYQSCLSRANRFKPGTDPEKHCECVANTYVRLMSQNTPFLNSKTMVAYEVQAYTTCSAQ